MILIVLGNFIKCIYPFLLLIFGYSLYCIKKFIVLNGFSISAYGLTYFIFYNVPDGIASIAFYLFLKEIWYRTKFKNLIPLVFLLFMIFIEIASYSLTYLGRFDIIDLCIIIVLPFLYEVIQWKIKNQ